MNLKNRIRKIEEDILKFSPDDTVEEYARELAETWVKDGLMKGPVTEEKVSSLTEKIKPPYYPIIIESCGVSIS